MMGIVDCVLTILNIYVKKKRRGKAILVECTWIFIIFLGYVLDGAGEIRGGRSNFDLTFGRGKLLKVFGL